MRQKLRTPCELRLGSSTALTLPVSGWPARHTATFDTVEQYYRTLLVALLFSQSPRPTKSHDCNGLSGPKKRFNCFELLR